MDKVIHVGVFTLAGIGLTWAYGADKKYFTYLFIYSIAIECAQGLTGYRSFDLLDILANTSGLFLARIIVLLKPVSTANETS